MVGTAEKTWRALQRWNNEGWKVTEKKKKKKKKKKNELDGS